MINFILFIIIVNYLEKKMKFSKSDYNKNERDTILILLILNIIESTNQSSELMEQNLLFIRNKPKKSIKVEKLCYYELKLSRKSNKQMESDDSIFFEAMNTIEVFKQEKIGVESQNNSPLEVIKPVCIDNIKEIKEHEEGKRNIEVEILYHPELNLFKNLKKQKEYNNNIIVRPTLITEVFKQDGKDSYNINDFVEVTEVTEVTEVIEVTEVTEVTEVIEVVESIWVANIKENKEQVEERDIEAEILDDPELKAFKNPNQQKEYNNSIIIEPMFITKVQKIFNFIDVLKQLKTVKERSSLNQIGDTIKRDYKGVNISTLVSDLGIITGEVVFNIKDVVSLKLSNNIIMFINSNSILGFF